MLHIYSIQNTTYYYTKLYYFFAILPPQIYDLRNLKKNPTIFHLNGLTL